MSVRLNPNNTITTIVISKSRLGLLRRVARRMSRIDKRASVSSLISSLIEQRRAHLEALASDAHLAPRADEARQHVREIHAGRAYQIELGYSGWSRLGTL